LPDDWEALWGAGIRKRPNPTLIEIKGLLEQLATPIPCRQMSLVFRTLVGAADLKASPIHRWYTYKEAFSPALPSTVLDCLNLRGDLSVADPFGGVATTAVSLQFDRRVRRVTSVEYSPLAHLVGNAKVGWLELDPTRMRKAIPKALMYTAKQSAVKPALSAFSDRRIFHAATVRALVAARDHLASMRLSRYERAFFRCGLAAIVEDVSQAMKDGRALRVLNGRRRRSASLGGDAIATSRSPVKAALAHQWNAMVDDLELLQSWGSTSPSAAVCHLKGDARRLDLVKSAAGRAVFRPRSVDCFIYSPPYLNGIDYSEVYKLELWLLGLVKTQSQFRRLRLGTLRSHPSLRFPDGMSSSDIGDASRAVDMISRWIETNIDRRNVGRSIRWYFEDSFRVYQEQFRILKPGGVSVCVVANSTYSRREMVADELEETWRIPLLTDVLLATVAKAAGFARTEIWHARDLRPRNTRGGRARESLVVCWRAE
jgi:hypothetical protein